MNNVDVSRSNYKFVDTNCLGSGAQIITLEHTTKGNKLNLVKVSHEREMLDLFKFHVLFPAEPNQNHTFIYQPSPSLKKALIIEFGVQNRKEGFQKATYTTLCIGSELRVSSDKEIVCEDSSSTVTTKTEIIPAEQALLMMPEEIKQGMLAVLAAERFEDLPQEVQAFIETQLQMGNHPDLIYRREGGVFNKDTFNDLKALTRSQLDNPPPGTRTTSLSGGMSLTVGFANKPKIDELNREEREAAVGSDYYSYKRVIKIAPEGESEAIVSEIALKTMKDDLKYQMEILGDREDQHSHGDLAEQLVGMMRERST